MSQLPKFQSYQLAFADHIRSPKNTPAPENVSPRGMAVYSEIVFNNIESTVGACFPVLKTVLGEAVWLQLVSDFLRHHPCKSPIFREIPEAFLDFLNRVDTLPPYAQNLAHYEWVELYVAYADEVADVSNIDSTLDLLDGCLCFNPAMALLTYDYPVHQISQQCLPESPLEEAVHFLVFRNAVDKVEFVELNAMTATLIADLQQGGLTTREALIGMASSLEFDVDAFVEFGLQILNDLKAQGVILGVSTT